MTLESFTQQSSISGDFDTGFLRSGKDQLTVPLNSLQLVRELQDNRILRPGVYPITLNQCEEVGIIIPTSFGTVDDVGNAISKIELPDELRLKIGPLEESIDFYVRFNGAMTTDEHSSRLRMVFKKGKLDSMRYIFAIHTGEQENVQWTEDIYARYENLVIVMRKFNMRNVLDQRKLERSTIRDFFAENCTIEHIVYKQIRQLSFGAKYDREYISAGYINERGEKVGVPVEHNINTVDYFLKGGIAMSTRVAFADPLSHMDGIVSSFKLRNGVLQPERLLGGLYVATEPSILEVEIEAKGDDEYRRMGAQIVTEIAKHTGATQVGAIPRKGHIYSGPTC